MLTGPFKEVQLFEADLNKFDVEDVVFFPSLRLCELLLFNKCCVISLLRLLLPFFHIKHLRQIHRLQLQILAQGEQNKQRHHRKHNVGKQELQPREIGFT